MAGWISVGVVVDQGTFDSKSPQSIFDDRLKHLIDDLGASSDVWFSEYLYGRRSSYRIDKALESDQNATNTLVKSDGKLFRDIECDTQGEWTSVWRRELLDSCNKDGIVVLYRLRRNADA